MRGLGRYKAGDRITYKDSHGGPLLTVLDEVEGQYLLENDDGYKFLRPTAKVDDQFRLVRPGP